MLPPFGRIFGMSEKEESIDEAAFNQDEVIKIPLAEITPNRFQPRTIFNEEKIEELAQTIHTHGMIQPIVVRAIEDANKKYEIIAGERRYRAVTHLGWETVPAIIRQMNDKETASVALIENLQREELTVIEEAKAYQRLLDIHELTQEALAQRLGKSQSTIANKLRLLKLPPVIHQAILEKQITERHARAMIKLKDPERIEKLLREIIEKELNVKQTEARINQLVEPKKKKAKPKFKGVSKDMRIAMNTIRQSLTMVSDTGVDLETDEQDLDDYYQITIKIPKHKK
ncbi:ParB family chromosome partitioning protein [Streptohalobacillus salinus]|uniref:Nucleoid occlusion protein n=1 Tax=Streptohalobacillus salinus TaxID=621096 RepID=A0A2V3W6Z5_9BACI|nr:nucleoid occlusion protein [Streptohalobacillus salinus]PXW89800.1 ParB family chromosome partitioning protein [Streptohalobacillus salinus]